MSIPLKYFLFINLLFIIIYRNVKYNKRWMQLNFFIIIIIA